MPDPEDDDPIWASWESLGLTPSPSTPPKIGGIAPDPQDLVIGTGSTLLVSLKPDGTIEYGPDYEPDEAARTFWNAMMRYRLLTDERLVIVQHMEALLTRLGAADLHAESLRRRATELAGSGREGALVVEAQQALQVLERIVHQAIELGRGLARRPEVTPPPLPQTPPPTVARVEHSDYDPSQVPDVPPLENPNRPER